MNLGISVNYHPPPVTAARYWSGAGVVDKLSSNQNIITMKKVPYYTHAGFKHADEVAGFAICEVADQCDKFVRLTDLTEIPDDGITGDIGRKYNPEKRQFDHHQGVELPDGAIGLFRRENGFPLATAGMIWKEYGIAAVMNILPGLAGQQKKVEAVVQRVDKTLIEGIDAHDADNSYIFTATCSAGEVRPVTISHIIAGMNGEDVSNHEGQAKRFRQAADLMAEILKSHVKAAAKFVEAKHKFEEVATFHQDGKVIELSEGLPWREIVHESYPDVRYVIMPSNHPGNKFSMTAVTVSPESRECIIPIERPEWFNGFIHQGQWIAGANTVEELLGLAGWNIEWSGK